MNEFEEIQNKIYPHKECPVCHTKANIKLTGEVLYTSPAKYKWKCNGCNSMGYTGYIGLLTLIIPDENKEKYDIEAKDVIDLFKLRELGKKYGKYKDRKLFFHVEI